MRSDYGDNVPKKRVNVMKETVRFLGVLFLCWMGVCDVLAQTGEISGRVHDAETGDSLPVVNVTLEREGAVVAGVATDDEGRYSMSGVPHGSYTLYARFIGYQTTQADVVIGDTPVVADLRMDVAVLDLEEVEVQTAPFQEESDPNVSLARISPREIRQLPGGGEDVMQTLQTLPGVQVASDFSNQLIVRGSTPDQNLIIMDEIEVFSPYQLSGVGSLLNPNLIRTVDLYAGAFPAMYGDRLSSVLAVQTRDGITDKWLGGRIGSNLVDAHAILEGKTGFWNGSWLVSGRQTYFDSFANTFAKRVGVFNEVAFPDFADVQFKLALRPARGHQLRITGLHSRDALDVVVKTDEIAEQGEDDSLLEGDNLSRNSALGLTWAYVPTADLQVKLLANWYRNKGANTLAGSLIPQGAQLSPRVINPPPPVFGGEQDTTRFRYNQAYGIEKASVGGQFVLTRDRHTLELGGGIDILDNALALGLDLNEFGSFVFDTFQAANPLVGALADSIDQVKRYGRYQLYVQDRIASPKGEVYLQPSLRYDYYGLIGKGYLSPRLTVSVVLNDATTVRFAGGRYIQSPGFEKLLDPDDLFNLGRYTSLDSLGVEEALHLGASLTRQVGNRWQIRAEGYWKQLSNLITQVSREVVRPLATYQPNIPTGDRQAGRLDAGSYFVQPGSVFELTTEPANDGSGKAYGLELFVEKRLARPTDVWSGWLSYAYAKAYREQNVAGDIIRFPFDYDRRHTLNLVVNRRLGQHFNVGVTWRFGSGFPYTPAIGLEPLVAVVDDPITNQVRGILLTNPETGYVRLVPDFGDASNINSARLPAYHRLDARVTYHNTWRTVSFEVYLDLINVYNRQNTVSYQYYVALDDDFNEDLPIALRPPVEANLLLEPIYMFPFIPSFGFSVSF